MTLKKISKQDFDGLDVANRYIDKYLYEEKPYGFYIMYIFEYGSKSYGVVGFLGRDSKTVMFHPITNIVEMQYSDGSWHIA